VESGIVSHTFIWVEFTVVEFTYVQAVTHWELDLCTKFGLEQAEHKKAPEDKRIVDWIPNG